MTDRGVPLRVDDVQKEDAGRGIVRIDPIVAQALGLETGDVVEVRSPKGRTAGRYYPYADKTRDSNTGKVRLDANVRRNAGVGLDDKVDVLKTPYIMATKVVIQPVEPITVMAKAEHILDEFLDRVVTKNDIVSLYTTTRERQDYIVSVFEPSADAVVISPETDFKLSEKPHKPVEGMKLVAYEDIGGLGDEVRKVREMIELPLKHPELFHHLGVDAPKGVLLHGPPGTGKTLLAKAVASEVNANFIHLSGPEIVSKYYGQSEENIRQVFQEAEENAPSIIFIDEIDSIAPKRDEVQGDVERRIVSQLLTIMDGLEGRGKVIVIAATNRPNAIDPALRRPGRFDREIEIGVPDVTGRRDILAIHTRGMPLGEDVDIDRLAALTHGYVGADVQSLTKEAAMRALRRCMPKLDLQKDLTPDDLQGIQVFQEDFLAAFRDMDPPPSLMREVFVENPDIHWEDVGGLGDVKDKLIEVVEWPLKHGPLFKHFNADIPRGILLHGPPGTGKTLLAKAVATESEANFISIKGPQFLSKWVGESEKAVRETFRKARQAAPSIIFLDEVDALAPKRGNSGDSNVTERVVSQMLTEMDGLEKLHDVMIIGATNRLDILDPALIRPGRFDRIIEIGLPSKEARKEILGIHLRDKPIGEVDVEKLVRLTEGMSGADISYICEEAIMAAVREALADERLAPLLPQVFDEPEKYKPELDGLLLHDRHFEDALGSHRKKKKDLEIKPPEGSLYG